MRNSRVSKSVIIVLAGLTLPVFQASAGDLNRDHYSPGGSYDAQTIGSEFGGIGLSVETTDGKTGKKLPPKPLGDGTFDVGNGLHLNQQSYEKHCLIFLRLNFVNQGESQRWLRLKVKAIPDKSAETWFFDGVKLIDPCRFDTICQDENLALPLAIIGRKEAGFAWGLNPETMLLSYVEQGASFSSGTEFWFGTKLVIDAGRTETLDLVLFGFQAKFGYLDAIQIYHDSFPRIFSVRRPGLNIDPRIKRGGCDYRVWLANQPEEARRFGGGWDWCLRSWFHAGDYLGRHWEIGKDNGDKKWFNRTSADKARKWMTEQHHKHERGGPADTAMLFYITQALTDAPTSDGSLATPLAKQVWPESYAGRAGYNFCYPWGDNTYSRYVMRDLGAIAAKLPISGFALDTARSPLKFFGEGIDDAPGRAYLKPSGGGTGHRTAVLEDGTKVKVSDDQSGVYSRLDLASSMFMNLVHEMRKGKYNLGVATNGCDWMEGFHTDTVLIEHTPNLHKDRIWIARLILGQKVMSWWDEFRLHTLIDWENLTPEELRRSVAAFSRYVRLRSFVLAGVPMYRIASGNEILFDSIPDLNMLTQAGWRATPAMTADSRLWTTRYGEGFDSFLVLCNPKAVDIETDLLIDGEYLVDGDDALSENWILRDWRQARLTGSSMTNTVSKINVPSAREKILRACLNVRIPSVLDSSTVDRYETFTTDRFNSLTVKIRWIWPETVTLLARAEQPEGFYLANMTADGGAVPFTRNNEFALVIDKAVDVELTFESLYFNSPGKDFLDFGFVRDGRPACAIVIPSGPTVEEEHLAFRFQEYFRYYFEKTNQENIILPIVKTDRLPKRDGLILIGRSARGHAEFAPWKSPVRVRIGVTPDKRTLYATALPCFDAELRKGVYRLFGKLDERYKYFGKIGNSRFEHPHEKELYQKAGLIGKVINDDSEEK